jgi:hypothetical protein
MKPFQILGSVGYGTKQVKMPETGGDLIISIIKMCLVKERTKRPLFPEIVFMLEKKFVIKGNLI